MKRDKQQDTTSNFALIACYRRWIELWNAL